VSQAITSCPISVTTDAYLLHPFSSPIGDEDAQSRNLDILHIALRARNEAFFDTKPAIMWQRDAHPDRTRTILDLGMRDAGEGQVARPVFDLTMESPLSLLGYIYFRLAQDLTRAARFGRCPECGTIFKTEQGDRRTYDTPQCAQRTRYRRYAERNPGYRRKTAERS